MARLFDAEESPEDRDCPRFPFPVGSLSDGFPVGLQIVGRAFDEGAVFQVAHPYEQSTDWHKRQAIVS
jgi:aspartyl-tRNA(Asn)/glutamyl-tRNA(Gln) amidotransferase subunit A